MQFTRQKGLNAKLDGAQLERFCRLEDGVHQFLELACERLNLSARAYHRIIRLARTIADMGGGEEVEQKHIAEAIAYRSLDRR